MPILGLMTAEQISAYRPKNVRRSVFYMYPNGSAPLTGLLTMMKDEVTNDPEYKQWEKRMLEQRTTLAYISSTISFYSAVDSTFVSWTAAVADFAMTAASMYGIKVAAGGTAQFRVGQIIRFNAIVSAVNTEAQGIVTYVDATNDRLAFRCTKAPGTVTYNGAHTGFEVLAIGTAQAEGSGSVSSSAALSTLEVYNAPISVTNYTGIFTANWQITGTAAKTSTWFDTRGIDPDQSKEAAVNYSRYMEYAFIFGEKTETVVSATNVTRTTGGCLYWLRLWEAGATYGNTAATADTDDTKRIITNSTGTLSRKTYQSVYLERAFRFCRNKQSEMIAFCGNGFLATLGEMYGGSKMFTSVTPDKSTFGMQVVAHTTSFGTVYYKTHPLFNLNSTLRFNALFLDIPCLKYRYLAGRDTTLRKNLQPNGMDYVEDGWFSECGLEFVSPESHLYIQNVSDWSP